MPNTTVYVLMMQNGDELTNVRVYSSRDAAENAIRLVAERDHGNLTTDLAAPPLAIKDCIAMMVRCCGYGSVRLVQAELNLDPGDYPEPADLYLPPAPSELIPA